PFLVELVEQGDGTFKPGRQLRASSVPEFASEENADWKLVMMNAGTGRLALPGGTVGHRWQKQKGKWNTRLEDARTGEAIDPVMYVDPAANGSSAVRFDDFSEAAETTAFLRHVPSIVVETVDGP